MQPDIICLQTAGSLSTDKPFPDVNWAWCSIWQPCICSLLISPKPCSSQLHLPGNLSVDLTGVTHFWKWMAGTRFGRDRSEDMRLPHGTGLEFSVLWVWPMSYSLELPTLHHTGTLPAPIFQCWRQWMALINERSHLT